MQRPKDQPIGSKPSPLSQMLNAIKKKGKIMIRDLWQKGTKSVHDMHVVNSDAKYWVTNTLESCTHDAAKAKKKMYLEA